MRQHAWMFLLFFLFAGCMTVQEKPPTVLETLTHTEALLTAAQDELIAATERGIVDTSSADYARAYHSLRRAGEILDMAWVAWQAGNTESAGAQAQVASAIYWEIRPIITELVDGDGSHSESSGFGVPRHEHVEPVRSWTGKSAGYGGPDQKAA